MVCPHREYYSFLQRNAVLVQATMWMKLGNTALRARSQTQMARSIYRKRLKQAYSIEIESRLIITWGWWGERGERR